MNAKITTQTDQEATLEITVTPEEISHAREHVFDKYRPQIKVSGFRPGKAPDNIVAREVGDATIQSESIDHAMSHAYSDAVFAEKLAVIGNPDISIEKWVPFDTLEFKAKVELVPPVKLPDYRKIKKAVKPATIDEKQIDTMVEDLRRRVAKRVPAIRPAEMGDEVKLDFDGTSGGEPVTGASAKGHVLKLGSGSFIPGFEEEVVGVSVGETKVFTVTFPDDYQEKTLAGKPVEFTIKVHEVIALDLPEVTDAFAAEVGPFKSVKELRSDIKDQLMSEAEEAAKREHENELLEEIMDKTEMKVPAALVSQQLERLKSELEQRLASSGLNLQQYMELQKKTPEELDKELTPEAEKRVKLALVLGQVAKDENMVVGPDEIEDELEMLRQRYTDSAMQQQLAQEKIKEDIYNHLMASKVINHLVEVTST